VDSAAAGGLPCCHDGGAGLSCAWAETVNAAATASAMTLFMVSSPLEPVLEPNDCPDAMLRRGEGVPAGIVWYILNSQLN
jgi:hypothetical protein